MISFLRPTTSWPRLNCLIKSWSRIRISFPCVYMPWPDIIFYLYATSPAGLHTNHYKVQNVLLLFLAGAVLKSGGAAAPSAPHFTLFWPLLLMLSKHNHVCF